MIYGLLYSQKKILWPWIFHSRSSRSLRGPTLKYIFPFQPFASSALAFSRLSDGGESAKVWKMRKRKAGEKGGGAGKRKFPPSFFLVCTSSILRTRLSRGTCGSRVCGNSCPRKGGIQWMVLHDAAPAFSISCPVHCTAKLAELEGSEALGVRVKKGRIFGTVYFCQSNKVGKLLISRFSIHSRGKLDLEFWYQTWNRRTLGISLGHGTCCAWLVVWYDFCSCWILTPWMPTYGSNNLPSYQ